MIIGGTEDKELKEKKLHEFEEHLKIILRDELKSEPTDSEFEEANKKMQKIAEMHKTGANTIYMYSITDYEQKNYDYEDEMIFNHGENDTSTHKLMVDEVKTGDLAEICTSALLQSSSLSTRSKLFLSIKWNNPTNSRRIMDQMPLDSQNLPDDVKLAYTGEALAYAAMNNYADIMEVLYDNGLSNVFLDIMITLDLGFRFSDKTKISHMKTLIGSSIAVGKFGKLLTGKLRRASSVSAFKLLSLRVDGVKVSDMDEGIATADEDEEEKNNAGFTGTLRRQFMQKRSSSSYLLPGRLLDQLVTDDDNSNAIHTSEDGWASIYDYYDTYRADVLTVTPSEVKKQRVDRGFVGSYLYVLLDPKSRLEALEDVNRYPPNLIESMQQAFGHQYLKNHQQMHESKAEGAISSRRLVYRRGKQISSECSLTFMHRAYWAILVDNLDAARVFMERCERKIATCMLLSRALRSRANKDTIRRDNLSGEADWYDDKIVALLDELMNDSGTAEENQKFLQLHVFNVENENKKHGDLEFLSWADNNHYEHAFKLFEKGTEGPQTLVDLALLTENKKFTAHDVVQKFLDDVWVKKGGQPDEWEEIRDGHFIRMSVSPRNKMIIQTSVYLLFMMMYSWFTYIGVRQRCDITSVLSTPQEALFWSFCIGFAWEEVEGILRDGFRGYLNGHHNMHDFSLVLTWGSALIIRMVVWMNMDSTVEWVTISGNR